MHFGFEPAALVADADLVIVLECDVPWYPHLQHPPAGCRVAHIGEDPFYRALSDAQLPRRPRDRGRRHQDAGSARPRGRAACVAERADRRAPRPTDRAHAHARARIAKDGEPRRAHLAGISLPRHRRDGRRGRHHLQRISAASPTIARARSRAPSSPSSPAGGLGWGLGAALGAKLAAPDTFVVATLGDGAYMFSNPTVGHWVGENSTCRSSPSSSTTAATAPCAARRCRCSRTAPPARTTAACSPISIRRRPMTK